jgi:hypothetical protein
MNEGAGKVGQKRVMREMGEEVGFMHTLMRLRCSREKKR